MVGHTHRHLQQHSTRLQKTMSAMSAPTAMMAIATPLSVLPATVMHTLPS